MKRKILVVAAVILHGTLHAQHETVNKDLDEVVVTATRKEQKQSQTGKVITVIDRATLENNPGKSLTEILNQYAGLFTVGANNAPASNQEFYMRGAATGNTLFLIDGIPLQDPSFITNIYDLNNIKPEHIERIEILKGAQSTLWGSAAVAGVINIITKKGGEKSISPSVSLAYGTYNTFQGDVSIKGSIKRFSYNVIYNRTQTDGFSAAYDSIDGRSFDKDGLRQNNFQANLQYRISDVLSIQLMSNYGQYKADADAGAYADDYDITARSKTFINNLGLHYKRGKTTLHLTQSFVRSDRFHYDDSTDVGALRLDPAATYYTVWSDAGYKGLSSVTELYGNYHFSSHASIVGGVQYIAQKTDQHYTSISNYGPYDALPISSDSAKARNLSVYASLLLAELKRFNIEIGGRYNHFSVYGNNTTFTFNPSYHIGDGAIVFLNVSSGYNTPSLYQLYSEYGNRDLKPEKSINYELGLQTFMDDNRNHLRIVAFKRDIKDLIIFYTNPDTYVSQYRNRDEQHDYGFEVESNVVVGNIGRWVNNFSYINGNGTNDGEKIRNLYRRPNFTFNSTLTLNPSSRLTLAPAFRFVGERLAGEYDLGGPNPMPAYYTVDCYVAYKVNRWLKLFGDFRNITDQKYFDVYGYNSRRFNFLAGLRCSL